MALQKIFAQLSCSDLAVSTQWFTGLFGRGPDATPMKGLAEWHHGEEAGFQLFQNPDSAGKGTLTLIVSELGLEYQRLSFLKPEDIERADYVELFRMRDPDNNLVVMAEPRVKET
jgi:hypothetical protein